MPTLTRTLSSGDAEIYYEDTGGDGRPVVLIHGWPLSGESWSGQRPALVATGHRVVTYDRRGFGRSAGSGPGSVAAYDYDAFAADLQVLMESLDLADATLVGFSMGGGEVARYVGRYGQARVRSVVFAAAIPPCLRKDDEHPEGGLEPGGAEALQAALRADREEFLNAFLRNSFSTEGELMIGETQLRDALQLAAQADLDAAVACISLWLEDFRGDLAQLTVPTLVIHGDGDAIVPFEVSGRRTHEAVAGSELVVVPGGPHGVNVSHPDQFNDALLDFLSL